MAETEGEYGGDSQLQKTELNWGRGEGPPAGGMQLGLSSGKAEEKDNNEGSCIY